VAPGCLGIAAPRSGQIQKIALRSVGLSVIPAPHSRFSVMLSLRPRQISGWCGELRFDKRGDKTRHRRGRDSDDARRGVDGGKLGWDCGRDWPQSCLRLRPNHRVQYLDQSKSPRTQTRQSQAAGPIILCVRPVPPRLGDDGLGCRPRHPLTSLRSGVQTEK